MRHFGSLLPALAVATLLVAQPATANGIDLAKRAAKPGQRVQVVGHEWLTCCPRNTPVGHVELFLLTRTQRLRLFDVPANREGTIQTAFEVPQIPAGAYRLEVCSRGPDLRGVSPTPICLPVETNFVVLEGRSPNGDGVPLAAALGVGLASALLFAVAVAIALLYRHRRSRIHLGEGSRS